MSLPVGGLRQRLIRDSLYHSLKASLTTLGWFDAGRQHKPLLMPVEPIDPLETVTLNSVGITDGGLQNVEWEVGSILTQHRSQMFVDVFAESETLGIHLSRDICDILEGRMPSIGASSQYLDVYDYTQATPPIIFSCEIQQVAIDRAHYVTNAWQKFWYSVSFIIVDFYGDEDS